MWNTEPSVTCSELDFQQHVCVCVRDVCSAIVELLAAQYIKIPGGQSLIVVFCTTFVKCMGMRARRRGFVLRLRQIVVYSQD